MAEESILKSIRSAVGLDAEDNSFDSEIILHVNGAIATLYQNGVGEPIAVTGVEETWDNFKNPAQLTGNLMFEQVKLFIFTKVKLLFDPPPPSTATYMNAASEELLWRLRLAYDPVSEIEEET